MIAENYVKKLIAMLVIIASIFTVFPIAVNADGTNVVLDPTDNQYLELRATDVTEVEGQNRQVIFQLWAHNLEFKGFQVRFSYDSDKVTPSNIETNEPTDDSDEYFKFENEFEGRLDFFALPYSGEGDGIEAILSLDPPVTTSTHIKDKGSNDYYIDAKDDDVLLGKMSFQMTEDVYEDGWFSLVTDSTSSPTTGIKISVTIPSYYESQSVFRFTDQTASKDADLSDLIVSHGEENELIPELSTYKEYDLDPSFDKGTYDYEVVLMEYIDDLDIKATKSDANSTMKIKVPKRDEDDNLVYENDSIVYEEKDLDSGVPYNVKINKLGEPDTVLTIKVTAEDTKTSNEYTVTIKRPYGTIRGSVKFDSIEENDNPDIDKTTQLNLYNHGDFNWVELQDIFGTVFDDPATYDDLDLIEKSREESTKEDGTYEIYVIPGTYDLQIDRRGFLDYIVVEIPVTDGCDIDLDEIEILAGDVDRDGIIGIQDIKMLVDLTDVVEGSTEYDLCYDLVQDGFIGIKSLRYAVVNTDKGISIKKYVE